MAQEIIRIETINTDVINVATTEVIKIEGVGLQGNSGDNVGVLSFNGRIGIVSPELDDYQASLVDNDSSVVGDTVKDALDTIQTDLDGLPSTFVTSFDGRTGAITPSLDDYQASLITNDSTETGATVKDALDALDIEQGEQDTAIQGNKDSITGLDLRVTQNETDITTINLEQVVQDNRLDAIDAEQIVQNDKLVELDDNITAIEDTAVFEAPNSPNPVNYIWLGTDIDYQAIITPQDDTIYNINNNLETKALWFKTQNVSPITPTITGTVADWKSVGSDEGTDLGVSNPTFTYTDSSVEHLVTANNFDPLDVTSVICTGSGISYIEISAFANLTSVLYLFTNPITGTLKLPNAPNCTSLRLQNTSIERLVNLDKFTGIINDLLLNSMNLTGHIELPIAPNMTRIRAQINPLLTSVSTIFGCTSLATIEVQQCALDLPSVDMIFNDTDANGVSGGSLNVSGGTNSGFSSDSSASVASLIGKTWTLTSNGAVPRETGALWFKTQNVATITPTLTGATVNVLDSDGGFIINTSAPSITWANIANEGLVEFADFDPLDVTQIDANGGGLQSISDLSGLTSITELRLFTNQLTDIGGLSALTSLNFLRLDSNQLTDIGDLSGLTSLSVLYLNNNQLTAIAYLSGLTSLSRLYLNNNQLTDIGDISSLTSLSILYLYNNQLTDIGGIGSASLTNIRLEGNALIQSCVDQVFNDLDSLGASNGSCNVSGGTNSAPSVASDTARTNLIGRGWTLTFN